MKKLALALVSLPISVNLIACEHIFKGEPTESDYIDCREGYAIGYNFQLKAADWVSYRLKKQTLEPVELQNDFRDDWELPEELKRLQMTTTNQFLIWVIWPIVSLLTNQ